MRVALDSNILIYLVGGVEASTDAAKTAAIRALLDRMPARVRLIVSVQALGETLVVLRRGGMAAETARKHVDEFMMAMEITSVDGGSVTAALDLAVRHRLQYWDALIVSAAAAAGCSLLLSEDMQDGFAVRGLTIVNPFASSLHPKLAPLVT